MYRDVLLAMLERYRARYSAEHERVEAMARFVEQHADCFLRSCAPGHITGSAWLTTAAGDRCVLVHHAALRRWLQPGGHADGQPEVHRTALREAQEETGLWAIRLDLEAGQDHLPVPLDIDIHSIPANRGEPAHLHYDVRFLVLAGAVRPLRASSESTEVRWFETAALADVTSEESVLRMARKAASRLNGRRQSP